MKVGLVLEGGGMRGLSRLEKDPVCLEEVYNLGLHDASNQWEALQTYLTK